MWIFLSDGFLSIVAHRDEPGMLLVRARKRDHLEAAFPEADIEETLLADYRFRTTLPRVQVTARLAEFFCAIDYEDFRDSIRDEGYHEACFEIWKTLHNYQIRSAAALRADDPHGFPDGKEIRAFPDPRRSFFPPIVRGGHAD